MQKLYVISEILVFSFCFNSASVTICILHALDCWHMFCRTSPPQTALGSILYILVRIPFLLKEFGIVRLWVHQRRHNIATDLA